MGRLHFDTVALRALACAVPSFVQPVNLDPSLEQAAYVRNFVRTIGIRQRHISLFEQTCTDLGYAAVSRALQRAGWEAQSLDALIFCSQMPDFNPGTGNAFILHKHLGLETRALAFDITLGCSSVPYGLSVCASLMQCGDIRRVALVAGDNAWPFATDRESLLRENVFMFGEATAALLLERDSGARPLDVALYSDGRGYDLLFNPSSGSRNNWRHGSGMRISDGTRIAAPPAKGENYMDGAEITAFSTTTVVASIAGFLRSLGRDIGSYDGLVLHQANRQIINTIARRLGADAARTPVSLDRYGNTSGASVLLTIADAWGGRSGPPLELLLCAYGIGLSWGVASLCLDPAVIEPVFTTELVFDEGYIDRA